MMVQPSCTNEFGEERSDNTNSSTTQASRDKLKQAHTKSSVDSYSRQGLVLVLCRQTPLGHDQMLEANIPSLWQHCQELTFRLIEREIPAALSYHQLKLQPDGFFLSILCENATCGAHAENWTIVQQPAATLPVP